MNAAFGTLWEALVTVCRLLAPMVPFTTDWVHRELTDGDSVHLERYPEPGDRRDPQLESAVELARQLSGMGRAARESAGIRVRQPLRRLVAALPDSQAAMPTDDVLSLVREELNIREISFVDDPAELISYKVEPQFAVLGPQFGAQANDVAEALGQLDGAALTAWRAAGGALSLQVSGVTVEVPADAVKLVEQARVGLVVQAEGGVYVGLDTFLDDELRREGLARELVNRIQRLRRDAGLELDDRIRLGIFGAQVIASAAEAHRDYIATEVLAVELEIKADRPQGGSYEHLREIKLEGNEALIGVQVS
jgi:isoleucyl-tRNA synthetase